MSQIVQTIGEPPERDYLCEYTEKSWAEWISSLSISSISPQSKVVKAVLRSLIPRISRQKQLAQLSIIFILHSPEANSNVRVCIHIPPANVIKQKYQKLEKHPHQILAFLYLQKSPALHTQIIIIILIFWRAIDFKRIYWTPYKWIRNTMQRVRRRRRRTKQCPIIELKY